MLNRLMECLRAEHVQRAPSLKRKWHRWAFVENFQRRAHVKVLQQKARRHPFAINYKLNLKC